MPSESPQLEGKLLKVSSVTFLQKFAAQYVNTIFLKFFGNENEYTKHLFENRLNTPNTPTFTFWRQGVPPGCLSNVACVVGASVKALCVLCSQIYVYARSCMYCQAR